MNLSNNSILTDLDTLFDTRFTMLYSLSKEVAKESITNGTYNTRLKNQFDNIPEDVFNFLYKKRDKRFLVGPAPTKIFNLINEYLYKINDQNDELGKGPPILFVNFYPYADISDKERETIIKSLTNKFKIVERVVPLFLHPLDLDCSWISKEVSTIVMYEGAKWLECQTLNRSILNTPIPDVSLIIPKLLTKVSMSREEAEMAFKESVDMSNLLIDLKFLEIKNFNIIN